MDMESVLVTGANRGIGLEFVKQLINLSKPPRLLFATYRDRSNIQALETIRDSSQQTQILLIKMDVTKTKEIEDARKIVEDMVGDKGLDLLINNAGVLKFETFPEITEDNMLLHFSTNTVGPVMVLKELFPLLKKSAAHKTTEASVSRTIVLNISSIGGSIGGMSVENPDGWLHAFGYRTSKAALNMAMRVVALTVKDSGILVVNLCPGWVKTDMGTDEAELEVTESVSAIMKTLSQLNESHHGTFIDRNGNTIVF
ncbi:putative oxidoreductase C663.06c like protein [Argiope bruennichi]|uniref:Putative oxidoreductase C663.06c like protein n=1 Tax=Argiope bruennichi TaxID=94029 RepID=A0A8T0EI06_ARGBR|nr:putative oxidoreductase C663.06c like protein [Argiope bruennichi]